MANTRNNHCITTLESVINDNLELSLRQTSYADTYPGQDLTHSGTHIDANDLNLFMLILKRELATRDRDTAYDAEIDQVDLAKKLFLTQPGGNYLSPLGETEKTLLNRHNRFFSAHLKQQLQTKQKFNEIILFSGLDAPNAGHFIDITVANNADTVNISILDTFSTQAAYLPENEKRAFTERLSQLFTALLERPCTIEMQVVARQDAADCAIHAVINKINTDHNLKLNLTAETIRQLRAALHNLYQNGNTEALFRLSRNLVNNALPLAVENAINPLQAAAIEQTHNKLVTLTREYANACDPLSEKYPFSRQLSNILNRADNTPAAKYQSMIEFNTTMQRENIIAIINTHRTAAWARYVYNAISILTVIPALVRTYNSYAKYNTLQFWQPESKKAYECAANEMKMRNLC